MYDHITPAMRDELHWFPVPQRLEYKVCRFVYKCLHHMAPYYLVKMSIAVDSVESRRHLRSAAICDLLILRTKRKTYGPRSFAVAAPSVWNSLPMSTRDPLLAFPAFHKCLKTQLSTRVYQTVLQYSIVSSAALKWRITRRTVEHSPPAYK